MPGRRPSREAPGHTGSQRTILIVEDELLALNLIAGVLTRADYRVLQAASASEALAVSADFGGAIDLIVADHTLQSMTGRQVAETILQGRPAAKVLHISGHSREMLDREGGLILGGFYLTKPFTSQTLLEKVRVVLYGAESPPS